MTPQASWRERLRAIGRVVFAAATAASVVLTLAFLIVTAHMISSPSHPDPATGHIVAWRSNATTHYVRRIDSDRLDALLKAFPVVVAATMAGILMAKGRDAFRRN